MRDQREFPSILIALDSFFLVAIAIGTVSVIGGHDILHFETWKSLSNRNTVINGFLCVTFASIWSQCLRSLGLYRRDFKELATPVLRAGAGCLAMTALLAYWLKTLWPASPIISVLITFCLVAFVSQICRLMFVNPRLRHFVEPRHIVILGSGRLASRAWKELRLRHGHSKRLLGFIDDVDGTRLPPDISSRFVGGVDDFATYLVDNIVDELVIAIPLRSCYDVAQRAVSIAEAAGVKVLCVSEAFSLIHSRSIRERRSMFVELVPSDRWLKTTQAIKRGFDFLGAGFLLVALSPVLLVIAILIKITSAGPVFFVQQRYGHHRRRFDMYKFRSMVQDAEVLQASLETKNEAKGPIFKIKNDPRITPLGSFLRRSSLDELPQLWNVVLGEMSLVGPRPMSVRDVSRFSEAQLMRRFSVRPGMTGVWQVAGRSSLTFDQWITLDFSYIDTWSLTLDLEILARTVPAVLGRLGAA